MRIAVVPLLLLLPGAAAAQRVIDPAQPGAAPTGPAPNPYLPAPAPAPPPPPTIYVVPPGGTVPGAAGQEPEEPEGLYLGGPTTTTDGVRYEGELPEVHVVAKGDTLWDICSYYFGDAWKWPEVWGLNPAITNPHWIYPGDLVRLLVSGPRAPSESPVAAAEQPIAERPLTAEEPQAPGPRMSPTAVELRQLAFVSTEDLKVSSRVSGSTQDKEMLSLGDEVYLEYPAGQPPQVGARYSIYAPQKDIKHPDTGAKIGHYVLVRGELQVLEVKKDKRALAIIRQVNAHGVIERGERVGTLKTQFKMLEPVPAEKSVEGVIAGLIGSDDLIGAWQVVFIDRGTEDGVRIGNRMLAVRRGDALPKNAELSVAGKDDRRYPDHYLGTLIIVDAGKTTAMGLLTRTDQELLIGDHVLMRANTSNP